MRFRARSLVVHQVANSLVHKRLGLHGGGLTSSVYLACAPSLVPRLSHCLVSDHLQYTQHRGGRPGIIYHVNDINAYPGRQRVGGTHD